jgi:hypothetical protein
VPDTEIPDELKDKFKKSAVADYDIQEEEEEIEEPPKKIHIDNNEIFKKTKADMKVKPVKKPKRQITEEHRERLRKGREKALANRRAKAAEKKKVKSTPEPKVLQAEEPAEKPVNKEVVKEVIVERVIPPQKSEQDIVDLVSKASRKAVEDYELLRKERKAEKLKKKEKDMERANINKIIKKATSTGIDINNPWMNCY